MGFLKNLLGLEKAEPIPDIGRNDPCWCGSGKKYKKCHMESDDKKRSRQIAKTCKSGS